MAQLEISCPPHEQLQAKNERGKFVAVCSCGVAYANGTNWSYGDPAWARFVEHTNRPERFIAYDIVTTLYGRAIRVL
jgi:hypothetical protein